MQQERFLSFQLWHKWLTPNRFSGGFARTTQSRLAILIHNPTTYSVNKTRKIAKPRFGRGMFRKWNVSLILIRDAPGKTQISVNLRNIMVNAHRPTRPFRVDRNLNLNNKLVRKLIASCAGIASLKRNEQLCTNPPSKNKS